jgi:hypothetical protein
MRPRGSVAAEPRGFKNSMLVAWNKAKNKTKQVYFSLVPLKHQQKLMIGILLCFFYEKQTNPLD